MSTPKTAAAVFRANGDHGRLNSEHLCRALDKKNTASRSRAQASSSELAHRSLALTDGRTYLGQIEQHGKAFEAFDPRGRRVGRFGSLALASDALAAQAAEWLRSR